jgi:carbon-monoxide dehydrogenase large subunit/6-hydroxypseudooxynicotine dehydrogenase subunit gamma
MAQICSDALGVDYDRIRVIHGQTDRIAHGIGAHASRATVLTGNAVHAAACKVRDKAVTYAAELMQLPAEGLRITAGKVHRSGAAEGPSIGLDEIARRVAPGAELLAGRDPGLSAEGWHTTDRLAFSCGVHGVVVSIDAETGAVRIERYAIAQEVGRAVNPKMVEGQVRGGCVQGIGGALYEEFNYSESGDPLSTTFADYLIPSIFEAPAIEVIISEEQPSPVNPLGLKGSGEGGVTGAGAAIANAVDDALGGHGIVDRLPLTPERVRRYLARLERAGAGARRQ